MANNKNGIFNLVLNELLTENELNNTGNPIYGTNNETIEKSFISAEFYVNSDGNSDNFLKCVDCEDYNGAVTIQLSLCNRDGQETGKEYQGRVREEQYDSLFNGEPAEAEIFGIGMVNLILKKASPYTKMYDQDTFGDSPISQLNEEVGEGATNPGLNDPLIKQAVDKFTQSHPNMNMDARKRKFVNYVNKYRVKDGHTYTEEEIENMLQSERVNIFGPEAADILEKLFNAQGYEVNRIIMSKGNDKLPGNSLLLNLSSATFCPSDGKGCLFAKACYAKKGEALHAKIVDKNEQNHDMIEACRQENNNFEPFFDIIRAYVDTVNSTPGDHEHIKFIRISENGDIGFDNDENNVALNAFIEALNKFGEEMLKTRGIRIFMYCANKNANFENAPYLTVNASNPNIKLSNEVYDDNGNKVPTVKHDYKAITPYEYNRLEDTEVEESSADYENLLFTPLVKKMKWRDLYRSDEKRKVSYYYKCPCGSIPVDRNGDITHRIGDHGEPIPANTTCRGCYMCFRNFVKAKDAYTGEPVTEYFIVSKAHGGGAKDVPFKGVEQAEPDAQIGTEVENNVHVGNNPYHAKYQQQMNPGDKIDLESDASYINHKRLEQGLEPINFDKTGAKINVGKSVRSKFDKFQKERQNTNECKSFVSHILSEVSNYYNEFIKD